MQTSQRFIHRDTLRLSGLNARESSLELSAPFRFSVRVDVAVQARHELLGNLCTLIFGQREGFLQNFSYRTTHGSTIALCTVPRSKDQNPRPPLGDRGLHPTSQSH